MKKRRMIMFIFVLSLLLSMTACGEKTEAYISKPEPDPAMPVTTAQILRFYNDALAGAVDSKISFAKLYQSKEDKFNLSPALMPFKSRMRDNTGVGVKRTFTVAPNSPEAGQYTCYLQSPSLTEADVKTAECVMYEGGLYQILIYLKDGESHASADGERYISSLDKCGIVSGDKSDDKADHNTARNIYEKLKDVSPEIRIDEKHTDAVVTALLRPDGTPVKLDVSFNTEYDIKSVYALGISAKGGTAISYLQFGAEKPIIPEKNG